MPNSKKSPEKESLLLNFFPVSESSPQSNIRDRSKKTEDMAQNSLKSPSNEKIAPEQVTLITHTTEIRFEEFLKLRAKKI